MIKKSYDDGKKHVHVLSYGGGTQSTALLLMALRGEINGVIPDYIIFSDTGWEPQHVYDWISKVNTFISEKYGREIIVTRGRNIRDDIINADTGKSKKFVTIPAYIRHPNGEIGMGRRQCTKDYKLVPINRKTRELLGYRPRQRVREVVHMWKGISTDEIRRVKPARDIWQVAEHPLIDVADMDRTACIAYVERLGLGTPPKSSCIGCPFHDNDYWRNMKQTDPVSWDDAVKADKALRDSAKGVIKGEVYLHDSAVPLDEVDFDRLLWKKDHQIDLFDNECEGMCGI